MQQGNKIKELCAIVYVISSLKPISQTIPFNIEKN